MTKRFATNLDVDQLLASKYSKGTDSFDHYTERILNEFISQVKIIVNYQDSHAVDDMLSQFYTCVKKDNGEYFSLNTFNSIRYSIARLMKDKHAMDITKDSAFARSNTVFKAVCKELKRNGSGAVNHYQIICEEDMLKISLWKWETPRELQWSVWFTLHFHTAMRGRENLHDLKKDDIIFETASGKQMVRLKDKLTKNHRSDTTASNGSVIFATNDESCPVKLISFYISKLNINTEFLWQKPNKATAGDWYANQKVGINTVNKFMSSLSQHLHLSKTYTNHSVRATSITILGRGFQDTDVATFSGHKSLTALGIYKRTSIPCKESMSMALHDSISSSSTKSTEAQSRSIHEGCCLSIGSNSIISEGMPILNEEVEDPPAVLPQIHEDLPVLSPMNEDEWSLLLNSLNEPCTSQSNIIESHTLNQQAIKKGGKIVIMNNCTIQNFTF